MNNSFGYSIACDNGTALVGAPEASAFRGAVYVFAHSGSVWTQNGIIQQAKLEASDAKALVGFGTTLAISGDTALVGAFGDRSAYVFVRVGGVWTQQAKLSPSDPRPEPPPVVLDTP